MTGAKPYDNGCPRSSWAVACHLPITELCALSQATPTAYANQGAGARERLRLPLRGVMPFEGRACSYLGLP